MVLDGVTVGVTGARKGAELVAALERRGARVVHGPSVAGDVPLDDAEVVAATDEVLAAAPRWLVASTGVGVRRWVEVADAHGRGDALRSVAAAATSLARGAKATGGLAALGVRPSWTAPSQTDAEVAAHLTFRVTPGEAVAVQLHGAGDLTPYRPVAEAGARLLPVLTYRHALPDDAAPARRLVAAIVDGAVDVVTFTSPGAVRNLATIAAQVGPEAAAALDAAFTGPVAIAVVGPVTGQAAHDLGWTVVVEPERWRTGDLLRALEVWAAGR